MAVHGSFNKVWKPVLVSASAILVVVALAGVFLLWHWPFSREAVLKDLEEASTSKVHMDAFHGTYFPRPGCELTHVTFQHNPKAGTLPLITIEKVRIEGTLWGVFTRPSAMAYKHTNKTVSQIGRELCVDFILEGS